jgi:hypothetical protein
MEDWSDTMTMTPTETLHKMAEDLAFSLGIPLYIRDGKIYQHGPGERIELKSNAKPDYSMHSIADLNGQKE